MADYFKDLAEGKPNKAAALLCNAYRRGIQPALMEYSNNGPYTDEETEAAAFEKVKTDSAAAITAAGISLAQITKTALKITSRLIWTNLMPISLNKSGEIAWRFACYFPDEKKRVDYTTEPVKGDYREAAHRAGVPQDAIFIPGTDFNAALMVNLLFAKDIMGTGDRPTLLDIVNTAPVNAFVETTRTAIDQKRIESENVVIDIENGVSLLIPIEEYNETALKNPNTDKLYKQIVLETAKTESRVFNISGKDFMAARKITDSKEAREQAKNALIALASTLLKYEGGKMGTLKLGHIINDAEMAGLNPGKGKAWYISGEVGRDLYEHIMFAKEKYLKKYPTVLFEIPNNKPSAYSILDEFSTHRRRNPGKTNENTLSVAKLLNICTTIPKYEDLKEKGLERQARQKIITPFINALEYLEKVAKVFKYRFQEPGGAVYKSGHYEAWENNYSKFITLMVAVEWAEPYATDQTHLIEQREKQTKKASKRKAPAK